MADKRPSLDEIFSSPAQALSGPRPSLEDIFSAPQNNGVPNPFGQNATPDGAIIPEPPPPPESMSWSDIGTNIFKQFGPSAQKTAAGLLRSGSELPERIAASGPSYDEGDGFLEKLLADTASRAKTVADTALSAPFYAASQFYKPEEIEAMQSEAEQELQALRPQESSQWTPKNIAYDIGASAVQMAPGFLASAITKNPTPALYQAGATGFSDQYQQQREGGSDPSTAFAAGIGSGGAEAITELLPIGQILKAGGGTLLKRLLKTGASEAASEAITESINAGIEKGTISPDMTLPQVMERIGYAGAVGGGSGVAIGAVTAPFSGKAPDDAVQPPSDLSAREALLQEMYGINEGGPRFDMRERVLNEILALPAPDTNLYADSQGNIADPASMRQRTAERETLGLTPDVQRVAEAQRQREMENLSPAEQVLQQLMLPAPASDTLYADQQGNVGAAPESVEQANAVQSIEQLMRERAEQQRRTELGLTPDVERVVAKRQKQMQSAPVQQEAIAEQAPAPMPIAQREAKDLESEMAELERAKDAPDATPEFRQQADAQMLELAKEIVRRTPAPKLPQAKAASEMQAAPIVKTKKKRRIKNPDIIQFIASRGGIRDESGELEGRDLHKKMVPGIGKLVRKDGLSFDAAREAAEEAGFNAVTINDMLEAIDNTGRGTRVFSNYKAGETVQNQEATRLAAQQDMASDIAPEDIANYANEGYYIDRAKRAGIETENRDISDILDEVAEREAIQDVESEAEGRRVFGGLETYADELYNDIPWDFQEVAENEQSDRGTGSQRVETAKNAGQVAEPASGDAGQGGAPDQLAEYDRAGTEEYVAEGGEVVTERTKAGQQAVIPGAERISDKELAERKMAEPKRAAKPQKAAGEDGGLFDEGERNQQDLQFSIGEEQAKTPAFIEKENDIKQRVLAAARKVNPNVKVKIVDQLFGEGQGLLESGSASTERQEVAGSYSAIENLITVALNRGNPQGTAFHEAWHSIEQMLNDGEKNILLKAFPQKGNLTHEEATAKAFEQWAIKRDQSQEPAAVKRIFMKVREFLRSLGNALRGNGFDSLDKIFQRAGKGDVAARGTPKESAPKEGTQYSYVAKRDQLAVEAKQRGKEGANDLKRWVKRNFTKEGLLGEKAFMRKLQMEQLQNVDELDIRAMTGDFERDVQTVYKTPYSKLSDAQKKALRDYLAGEDVQVPDAIKPRIAHMRAFVDRMSARLQDSISELIELKLSLLTPEQRAAAEEYFATDGESGKLPAHIAPQLEMLQKIESNKGKYLNRSYQAFDDPKWKEKVLKDKAVIDAAEAFIAEQNKDLSPEEVTGAVRAILQSAKDKTDMMGMASSGVKVGKKDVSFLKKRKDVPPQIRALLGEYEDPKVSFVKTATKMSRHLAGHYFLTRLRKDGMGTFLFEKPTGEFDTQVAGDESQVMNPLNGLYSSEDFVQGMQDAGFSAVSGWPEWLKGFVALNSMVKYGKTILAPTTQMRNFISAGFFSIANGHFDWSRGKEAFSAVKNDMMGTDEKWRDYLRKVTALGVIHDNPYSQELKQAIKDITETDWLNESGSKIKTVLDIAQRTYRAGDDFWKILGFENEKSLLMKHRGMDEKQAETEAARRIRDGYPTYSMVPRGIRSIRRWPFTGAFVSFPWEIARTSRNLFMNMVEDYKAGAKGLAAIRALGIAIAASAAHAASAISMAMLGLDDDDDEAVRSLAPEWQKNAQLAYLGYDDDGMPEYLDLSHLDPYSYLKKPISALMNGNTDGMLNKSIDSMSEMLAPFIGPDILASTVGEVLFNQKLDGGQVYNPQDMAWDKGKDIANHVRKAAQPGVAGNMERIVKSIKGDVSSSGKKYDLQDEIAALFGFRLTTLNIPQSIIYKGYEFQDRKRNSTRILNSVVGSPENLTESDIEDAFSRSMNGRNKAYKDIAKLTKAATNLGMEKRDLQRTMRAGGIAVKDINALLSGGIPPWVPTADFLGDARSRALSSAPNTERRNELKKEFSERIRTVRQLAAKERSKNKTNTGIINQRVPLTIIREENPGIYPLMRDVAPPNARTTEIYRKILTEESGDADTP